MEQLFAALLYHRQRPCANPGDGQDEQTEGEQR
jgi:hypothetical protein